MYLPSVMSNFNFELFGKKNISDKSRKRFRYEIQQFKIKKVLDVSENVSETHVKRAGSVLLALDFSAIIFYFSIYTKFLQKLRNRICLLSVIWIIFKNVKK